MLHGIVAIGVGTGRQPASQALRSPLWPLLSFFVVYLAVVLARHCEQRCVFVRSGRHAFLQVQQWPSRSVRARPHATNATPDGRTLSTHACGAVAGSSSTKGAPGTVACHCTARRAHQRRHHTLQHCTHTPQIAAGAHLGHTSPRIAGGSGLAGERLARRVAFGRFCSRASVGALLLAARRAACCPAVSGVYSSAGGVYRCARPSSTHLMHTKGMHRWAAGANIPDPDWSSRL